MKPFFKNHPILGRIVVVLSLIASIVYIPAIIFIAGVHEAKGDVASHYRDMVTYLRKGHL